MFHKVYWIDAWRDADGGWYENNKHTLGTVSVKRNKPRAIYSALREAEWLSDYSKGRVAIDWLGSSGEHAWIMRRSDGMPLLGLEPLQPSDTEIHVWQERDRQHVELRDTYTQETIVQWWDEDVSQAVEDGFLDPADWHGSAFFYAETHSLI